MIKNRSRKLSILDYARAALNRYFLKACEASIPNKSALSGVSTRNDGFIKKFRSASLQPPIGETAAPACTLHATLSDGIPVAARALTINQYRYTPAL